MNKRLSQIVNELNDIAGLIQGERWPTLITEYGTDGMRVLMSALTEELLTL